LVRPMSRSSEVPPLSICLRTLSRRRARRTPLSRVVLAIAWFICLRVSGAVAPSASAGADLSRSDSVPIFGRRSSALEFREYLDATILSWRSHNVIIDSARISCWASQWAATRGSIATICGGGGASHPTVCAPTPAGDAKRSTGRWHRRQARRRSRRRLSPLAAGLRDYAQRRS
jgi:hypothetical protein